MEDSFKGLIIATTLVVIFMASIFGFITGFPEQQGMTFSEKDNQTYIVMQNIDMEGSSELETLNNQSNDGFAAWDITQGFMGSNTQKGAKSGSENYALNTFDKLKLVSDQLFDANNPVSWVLGILTTLLGLYITYVFIKFVRTGN